MNFVKRSLMGGIRDGIGALGGVGASERVGALLLPTSDLFVGPWGLACSSCSPIRSAGGLLQGFHQAQDSGGIAIEI